MPPALLELFAVLGINPEYVSDMYDYGKDLNTGLYRYGGWYYFVGTIVEYGAGQPVGDFEINFSYGLPMPPEPLQTEPILAAVDFTVTIPWGISDPEPVLHKAKRDKNAAG